MRARTSVTMLITGGVLTLAVRGHPSFFDVQRAGVILMMIGAIGLWPRGGRAWLLLARARLRKTLAEIAPVQGIRVPLEDLLGAGRAPGRPMFGSRTRGTQLWRVPADPPEVTSDDQAGTAVEAYQGQ
jgi:hypothetical protein